MSKYKGIIEQAREPETQKPIEPENQKEEEVNLCVKVPRSLRHHWAVEAKRTGITMTQVIVTALENQFGKPDNQKKIK
ncbi:MAG: hypothetical protein ACRCZS_03305 [Chroococcidiopsis sp.]